jgi:hypothetical protein
VALGSRKRKARCDVVGRGQTAILCCRDERPLYGSFIKRSLIVNGHDLALRLRPLSVRAGSVNDDLLGPMTRRRLI